MLWSDIRYTARLMRRVPLFTATIIFTVMLAIAANVTIFSVVNSVLLRPLPFRQPGRLVQIAEKNDKLRLPAFSSSVLNFLDWRDQSRSFEELAAIGFTNYTLTGSGEPEQFSGYLISPALPHLLGIRLVAGRAFTAAEEQPGTAPVAMLGEGLWKRRFAGDRGLIGRTIVLNGTPTTVVGIAPAALNLITGGDVYTPLVIDRSKENRLSHLLLTVGRLKPGVTTQQAQAEMNGVSARMAQQYPQLRYWTTHLISIFDTFVSADLKNGLVVLMWAVVFVLLIACANIANLLLARAAARQGEMAMRTAIGASRRRLVRQLLVESVLLSLFGGGAGIGLAFWALYAINHALPPNTLPIPAVEIDATVLWFALGLTTLTGLVFGIVPAWRAAQVDLNTVLKQGGRGSQGQRMSAARLRNGLAAAEIALATVLLIGAGLFIRSLANLERVPLGFEPSGLMTFQLAPPPLQYPTTTKAPLFYRALLDALCAIPGARGAAVSSAIPFGAGTYSRHPMVTTDRSVLPPNSAVPIDWRIVSPGFFKTMGIPLLAGRNFTDADGPAPSALPVTIVSQATAKKFWGDENPLGHTLRRSADPRIAFTIVGVVGDVRNTALTQDSPSLYYPVASRVWPVMDIVVRTNGVPEQLMPAIRQKVRELDPQLALANVRTMDQWLSATAAQPRLNTVMLGAFGFVAVLIASIGIYGVLAYSVSQRTGEIGVRLALGATPREVLRLIVGEGMTVVLIGIAAGLVAGLALGQTVSSLVFGVPVRDPLTFLCVAVALTAVALAACAIPALRASRVDPITALR